MNNTALPRLTLLAVILLSRSFLANADEEKKAATAKLPAESEKWSVDFEGYGGTPGDRSKFHLKVSHDASVEVQTGRGSLGPPTKGKLTPPQLQKVYLSVSKILKDYDESKSSGKSMDGWWFTLRLKGDSSEVSAEFGGFGHINDASPEFKEIQKIINQKFPKIRFPE